LRRLLKTVVRYFALNRGWFANAYIGLCQPRNDEYACFIKRHGKLNAIGENCRINFGANITHPEYVRIGNNVTLSDCSLIGSDGVDHMLNVTYGLNFDSIGKIRIMDNVFIGHNAIVLPNITIGQNAVVAAGAVVTKDVAPGDIVGGNPAKPIGRTEHLAKNLQIKTHQLPWVDLILNRDGAYDPKVEKKLLAMRVKHFFSNINSKFCLIGYELNSLVESFSINLLV